MRLGVDSGGTFTDFLWQDADGGLHIHKQLSSPDDPAQAIVAGINHMTIPIQAAIVHGSTVATNALLERRGAKTALIATKGFGDILAIGRQNRPDLYALVPQKPPPLIPKKYRFEADERISAQGEILQPLDETTLQPILERLAAEQIESVAICLLFSFLRPEHEQKVAEAIQTYFAALPALNAPFISLSSEILPEYREYERTSVTAINAYVAPLMSRYLSRLAAQVAPRSLAIMQSNGGIIQAQTAGWQAARTALSGPAGGVVGAQFVAQQSGLDQLITFDMGGTSADVALIPGNLPATSRGEIAGMPLRLPIIDIHTVGAGGGSIAWIDNGGALQAGPQSAGANPGPACYQQNPSPAELLPTVTDANLLLGRLDADHFLGGDMRLNEAAAERALMQLAAQTGVAAQMDIAAQEAAWGTLQVANATMERAVRRISVERGYDPRRFTLVAFGGAGPLHACDLAAGLGIPNVLVPRFPGVLSALGMLAAAPGKDYSQTYLATLTESTLRELAEIYAHLKEKGATEMAEEGHELATLRLEQGLDMRYQGQSHELQVSVAPNMPAATLAELFHQAHQERYGYHLPDAGIELVTLRLKVTAPTPQLQLPSLPASVAADPKIGEKKIWFDAQRPTISPMYQRELMPAAFQFDAPALIVQYDATTVVPPNWQGEVERSGNLLLTKIA